MDKKIFLPLFLSLFSLTAQRGLQLSPNMTSLKGGEQYIGQKKIASRPIILKSILASRMQQCRCTLREQCITGYPGNFGGASNNNMHQASITIQGQGMYTDYLYPASASFGRNYSDLVGHQQALVSVNGSGGGGEAELRIVNRPNVVCLHGEVYCCSGGNSGRYPTVPPSHQKSCGTRHPIQIPGFILEYGQAAFASYPWMVVMTTGQGQGQAQGQNYGPMHFLGAGALIDHLHVLTAAHKVKDYVHGGGFRIRLGEWNTLDNNEPYKYVEVEVARIDIHPQFNPQNLYNDLAIVRLTHPVSFDTHPHINSVCLPTPMSNFVGSRCWTAGFGKDAFGQGGKNSHILREVDVPILDSFECEARLRSTGLGSQFILDSKSFLCAGGESGKDSCTGDGGSALVCDVNGKFTVVGLVAWGVGCASLRETAHIFELGPDNEIIEISQKNSIGGLNLICLCFYQFIMSTLLLLIELFSVSFVLL